MRELSIAEMEFVSGAGDECSSEGNNYGGITEPATVGEEIVEIYEGLVEATSHIIERVANAF